MVLSQPKDVKASDSLSILALVEARLRKTSDSLSATRIRDLIKNDLLTDIAASALDALLQEETRKPHSSIRMKRQGALNTFFIGQENIQIEEESERSLYAPFAALLQRKGLEARILEHVRATRGKNGENHWRYPDIIAFKPSLQEPQIKKLAERTGAIRTDSLIAFELKRELQPGSIRAAFFQCLANSFWANQRYVVAPAPEIHADAHEAFLALSKRFNVGLIEIVWGNPRLRDMENYKIVVECNRTELDLDALQSLRKAWKDLDNFLGHVAQKG